jgi:hypothetical protein
MDSSEFAREMEARVAAFCRTLDARPPAYSYIPLTNDEQRIKVMKSRLFNEVRAGEVLGTWLKGTPEREVKFALAHAVHEEFLHAELLAQTLKSKGVDPYDYRPMPAQVGMFNASEALTATVERMATFPLAGEGVADYLIAMCLRSQKVPRWVLAPYRDIHEDEQGHGNYPAEVLAKYAITEEQQDRARRGVEMGLMLRQQYFDSLDRWVFEDKAW